MFHLFLSILTALLVTVVTDFDEDRRGEFAGAGVPVVIYHYQTGAVMAEGVTDEAGQARFHLPSDNYIVTAHIPESLSPKPWGCGRMITLHEPGQYYLPERTTAVRCELLQPTLWLPTLQGYQPE